MADEDEDPFDEGAPPVNPNMRVWTNPAGDGVAAGPHTEEERRRFNIPDPAPPVPASATPTLPGAPSGNAVVLTALIAKFPDFRAEWPAEVQSRWFDSFAKLMEAGLR